VSEERFEFIAAQNRVLAHIAADEPLPAILDLLVRSIEEHTGGAMLASVLLMDNDGIHLRHGAAPSLPPQYVQAIDGSEIGPANGSCGTAAFLKTPVYVSDIESDPLWADYRHLAVPHGFKACWSTPILSKEDAVLGTFALYHRKVRLPEQREKELVELFVKTATLAIERHRAREQQNLLLEEMVHRVKNTLAVVLSIAGSTLRGRTEPTDYRAFENRLIALSNTQGLLVRTNWMNADIHELITVLAVKPFASGRTRFVLDGPPALLGAQLILPFALALHELCTNAAKYGALSGETGSVLIRWGFTLQGDEQEQFRLAWSETGGPVVHEPDHHGFGTRVINHAFANVAGSAVTVDYRPEGYCCDIVLPVGQVSRPKLNKPVRR
jgi:two-component sensor histidine kinase